MKPTHSTALAAALALFALGAGSVAQAANYCTNFAAQTGAITDDAQDIYLADHFGLAKSYDPQGLERTVHAFYNVQPWDGSALNFHQFRVRYRDYETSLTNKHRVTLTLYRKALSNGSSSEVVSFDSNQYSPSKSMQFRSANFGYHQFDFANY